MSPELVLVDPSLADRERQRLPVASVVRTGRGELQVVGPAQDTPGEIRTRMRDLGGGRFGASVAIVSTVLAIFSLTEVRIEFGDRSEPTRSVQQTMPQDPPATLRRPPSLGQLPKRRKAATTEPEIKERVAPATPSPVAGSGRTEASDAPQRFAWAPTPDASGYRVELFRSGVQVFAANTRQPAMTLPRSWTFDGRSHSLEAGAYTWYVWALEDGRRATRATVQARLFVPSL